MIQRQPGFRGRIGVARRDITPPVGIYARNWGAAAHDLADGIHRPLTLTCLSFLAEGDARPFLLMSADLGWWKSSEDEWLIRGRLIEELSLDSARCLFCLAHTHAGPAISREDSQKPGGELIAPYLEHVASQALSAARKALAEANPAILTWRYGVCDLAAYRDLHEPDQNRYVVGYDPKGSADDTLLVGRVSDTQGITRATIVNYACHPTTLSWENRLISPDYPGSMRELVEANTRAPCVFLQGASGELAPPEQHCSDPTIADSEGRQLGHAVLATLEAMLPAATRLRFGGVIQSGAPVAVWRREPDVVSTLAVAKQVDLELELRELPSFAQLDADYQATTDRVARERIWRLRALRRMVGDGRESKTSIWCWRLGDTLLFGHPHEAYSIFQRRLREKFPDRAVVAINIANGYGSYLPPREIYGRGVYSSVVTPFAAGSLERLTDHALAAGERINAL